jgi:hypothetical protein
MRAAVFRRRTGALAVVVAVVAAAGVPAEAGQAPGPRVDVQSAARLDPDGRSMVVTVLASCPERWTVVEAVVAVSQPQGSGRASFPLTCIGSMRSFGVRVPAAVGTFDLADAQVDASVVMKRGRFDRADDSEIVDVQPGVFVDLADTARLETGGAAVVIDVTTACPVGATGQESRLNVAQAETWGNGLYTPVCDGHEHTFTVRVPAAEGVFQPGSGRAMTFADVEHDGFDFAGFDETPVTIVT